MLAHRLIGLARGADYATEVLADSPTAYWRVSGSALDDVVGTADITSLPSGVSSAASIVPGAGGQSLAMTGANAVTLTAGSWAPSGNADRSMEVWFTTTASPATSDDTSPGLIGYGSSPTRRAFNLRPANTADVSPPADLAYKVWVWADDLIVTNSVDWNTGSRVHAVVTYNGTSRALKLYLNGAEVGSRTLGGDLTTPSGTTFYIGGHFVGVPWVGNLQEPAVYASELSAARILAHYNAGIA